MIETSVLATWYSCSPHRASISIPSTCRAMSCRSCSGVRAQLSRGQPAFERDRGRHHPGGDLYFACAGCILRRTGIHFAYSRRPGRGAARAAAHAVARHRRPRQRQRVDPALSTAPWASISACFLMGAAPGGLLPAIVPAVLADLHGARCAQAYARQVSSPHAFGLARASGEGAWRGRAPDSLLTPWTSAALPLACCRLPRHPVLESGKQGGCRPFGEPIAIGRVKASTMDGSARRFLGLPAPEVGHRPVLFRCADHRVLAGHGGRTLPHLSVHGDPGRHGRGGRLARQLAALSADPFEISRRRPRGPKAA